MDTGTEGDRLTTEADRARDDLDKPFTQAGQLTAGEGPRDGRT